MVSLDCPICKNQKTQKIQYGNHSGKLSIFLLKHYTANMICRSFLGKYFPDLKFTTIFSPLFNIIRCSSCGYGYYERKISEKELLDYYKHEYWANKKPSFPSRGFSRRAISQYKFVERHLKKSKLSILDIGAASSDTPRLIRQKRKNDGVEIGVVEPGQNWLPFYKKKNIKIISNFFPTKIKKKFDYIHTSHWLEHALDLKKIMKSLNKLAKKDGLIFVEVPNCNQSYFQNGKKRDVPHIHFFTKRSLEKLFINYGFRAIDIDSFDESERTGQIIKQDNGKWVRGLFQKNI
jgi:SAM-dependent methyltransferase